VAVIGSSGSTLLRKLSTGRDGTARDFGTRTATARNPARCRVASLTRDGRNRIELMRPGGSDRERIAGDSAATRDAIVRHVPYLRTV